MSTTSCTDPVCVADLARGGGKHLADGLRLVCCGCDVMRVLFPPDRESFPDGNAAVRLALDEKIGAVDVRKFLE